MLLQLPIEIQTMAQPPQPAKFFLKQKNNNTRREFLPKFFHAQ